VADGASAGFSRPSFALAGEDRHVIDQARICRDQKKPAQEAMATTAPKCRTPR